MWQIADRPWFWDIALALPILAGALVSNLNYKRAYLLGFPATVVLSYIVHNLLLTVWLNFNAQNTQSAQSGRFYPDNYNFAAGTGATVFAIAWFLSYPLEFLASWIAFKNAWNSSSTGLRSVGLLVIGIAIIYPFSALAFYATTGILFAVGCVNYFTFPKKKPAKGGYDPYGILPRQGP